MINSNHEISTFSLNNQKLEENDTAKDNKNLTGKFKDFVGFITSYQSTDVSWPNNFDLKEAFQTSSDNGKFNFFT
jgi:hypothetical protein